MSAEGLPLVRWLELAERSGRRLAFRSPRDHWRTGEGALEVLAPDGAWLPVPGSWVGRTGTEGPEPGWSSVPMAGRPWLVLSPEQEQPAEWPDEALFSLARCHDLLGRPGSGEAWPDDPARAVRRGNLDADAWLEGWGIPPAASRPWRAPGARLGVRLLSAGLVGQLELKAALARQLTDDRPLGQLLGLTDEVVASHARSLAPVPACRDPLFHPWLVLALWGLASWGEAAQAWRQGGWAALDAGWAGLRIPDPLRARAAAHVRWLTHEAPPGPRLGTLLAARGMDPGLLADGLARQVDQASPLGHLLLSVGHLAPAELAAVLAEQRMERRLAAWDRVPPPPPPLRRPRPAPDEGLRATTTASRRPRRSRWLRLVAAIALPAGLTMWWLMPAGRDREEQRPRGIAGMARWLGGGGTPAPVASGRPDRLEALAQGKAVGPAGLTARFEGQREGSSTGTLAMQSPLGRDGPGPATTDPGVTVAIPPEVYGARPLLPGQTPGDGQRASSWLGRDPAPVKAEIQAEPGAALPTMVRSEAARRGAVAVEGRPLQRDGKQDMASSGTMKRTGEWVSQPLADHRLQQPTEALARGADAGREPERGADEGVRTAQARFRARLGLSAMADGDRVTARQAFEEALRDDPAMAIAHWHLAELAMGRGDKAEARRRLQAYLRLAPEGDEAATARDRLKTLR
ncbi:MAG: tetratricopeptide repeat protein [Candidatus Sericytochromatia bacterium]|nr:tetratricopeptide repeat protein [Candidatus Sericytochromatia bacterium]